MIPRVRAGQIPHAGMTPVGLGRLGVGHVNFGSLVRILIVERAAQQHAEIVGPHLDRELRNAG
jgi:hypothetical protein